MLKSSQFNDYSVQLIHTLFYIRLCRTGLSIVTESFPDAGIIRMCDTTGEGEVNRKFIN